MVSAVCLPRLGDNSRRVSPRVSGRKFPFPELTLPFGKRWQTNRSSQTISTMALTLSFNAAKRVCNRVCGRARLEIQSALERRRRFTPALIVLPAGPVEEAAMDRLKLETA